MAEIPKVPGHFAPDTHGVSDPLLLRRRGERAHWQNTQAYQREALGERMTAREVFKHENELSRWITTHLPEVARPAGIEGGLHLVGTEHPAGRGRIDVLAEVDPAVVAETRAPAYVVIENQLTPSDDDHLARLIKYAAVIGAKHAVWIAPSFSDDHVDTICQLTSDTRCSFTALRLVTERVSSGQAMVSFEPVADFAALRAERNSLDSLLRDDSWAHRPVLRNPRQDAPTVTRFGNSPWFKPPRQPQPTSWTP
ncbi:hypothetical protein [Kitasatospora sp. NPDC057541]|uniref:hypothetical protein n=1 Tax=Kitasatospora sp. NPDC057541 TaxID=3346161 RepID=UPI0036B26080